MTDARDLDLTWAGVVETLAPILARFGTDPDHTTAIRIDPFRIEVATIDDDLNLTYRIVTFD
jgi:hypothetical protein